MRVFSLRAPSACLKPPEAPPTEQIRAILTSDPEDLFIATWVEWQISRHIIHFTAKATPDFIINTIWFTTVQGHHFR